MTAFQSYITPFGDLAVRDGAVFQESTGVLIRIGAGGSFSGTFTDNKPVFVQPVPSAGGSTFVGGSGRNLTCTGLPAAPSSAATPTGWFTPSVGGFQNGGFSLAVTDPDNAEISDGTDVVAILTTGGAAPEGDYDSTAYGQATYGEIVATVRQPFTLTVAGESGGDIPDANVFITAGTAQGGLFNALSDFDFESDVDPDWTIQIHPDGTADLLHLTDVIATRAVGPPMDPTGPYEATALGMATYNLTVDQPVDGEAWRAFVQVIPRAPNVGTAYIEIVRTSGTLSAVNGPFFATSMPSPSGDSTFIPLAICDGFSVEQLHSGMIII